MNMKKYYCLSLMILGLPYFYLGAVALEFSAPTSKVPTGIQVHMEDGQIKGGILMPGQTLRVDAGIVGISKIRHTEGCGDTFRVVQYQMRLPPRWGLSQARIDGDAKLFLKYEKEELMETGFTVFWKINKVVQEFS